MCLFSTLLRNARQCVHALLSYHAYLYRCVGCVCFTGCACCFSPGGCVSCDVYVAVCTTVIIYGCVRVCMALGMAVFVTMCARFI